MKRSNSETERTKYNIKNCSTEELLFIVLFILWVVNKNMGKDNIYSISLLFLPLKKGICSQYLPILAATVERYQAERSDKKILG